MSVQYYIAIDDEGLIYELDSNVYVLKKRWPEHEIEKCSKIMAVAHLVDKTSLDYMQCEKVGDTYYLIEEIEVARQKQVFFEKFSIMVEGLAGLLEVENAK